jgi:REP element-mobilizing transposase RayT
LILKSRHRKAIKLAIRETCSIRKWPLYALNVRSNHIHVVVAASNKKPELVLGAFKANATRQLRENGFWLHPFTPWADGGSKRRLWNEESVAAAIDYVLYGQGNELPELEE